MLLTKWRSLTTSCCRNLYPVLHDVAPQTGSSHKFIISIIRFVGDAHSNRPLVTHLHITNNIRWNTKTFLTLTSHLTFLRPLLLHTRLLRMNQFYHKNIYSEPWKWGMWQTYFQSNQNKKKPTKFGSMTSFRRRFVFFRYFPKDHE